MRKQFIKNIKGLVQAGEDLPMVLRGSQMNHLPIIENAFLALEDNEVIAYGPMNEWPGITDWREVEVIDASNCYVLPAFIDSHTHTVFAASREEEFVDRINGLSYEEIAAKGGGILNSAKKLNQMTEAALYDAALARLHKMQAAGTGAVEIKSGYGLSVEGELKMLRVIQKLKAASPIEIKATFLGAHAIPQDYKTKREAYISLLINDILPVIAAEQLADYIDVFCERNYFSTAEMEQILDAGAKYGLKPKVHVNQFSVLGGVPAAIAKGAISVDHLEELDQNDLHALANSNCVATLLPGCSHFLSIPFGAADQLMAADAIVALASDFNPGSSPSYDLMHVLSLACIKMKMTPEAAINALTINAAAALELGQTHGQIALGRKSPILLTNELPSLAYLAYAYTEKHIQRVFI
ncbi:MAG: imidazolonepropionase [Crocinitomicaceae bacterium]|jgi:imidazolonepropionase|nr:imidazolonepropionase [Crocinitomicaceae bacterium]MDP4723876.1 imidazolonepropionase [Crocinitomicaceae bacterium]MDP4738935.1 imidazolonepropionase [Crocinitomicaceae bacterium]MDP4799369.1 imidazolonepropionase [Crocinitomicaceae bacterium]MDP4807171.1 imidazolonepropionase [Crocinitomicaceae bacterium]